MPPQMVQDAPEETVDIFEQLIGNSYVAMVVKIIAAIAIVAFFVMIAKVIAATIRRKILVYADHQENKAFADQIAHLIEDITFYALTTVALFIGFEIIGFDVGLILGGVSFGVGLAFKEVLGNMIAGIFLLTMKEIKLGDIVHVKADQEFFGKIEEINIRTTTIRTFDMKQVIIPNIKLIDSAIQTYSSEEMIRLETFISVHYDSDLLQVQDVFLAAINSCTFVQNPSKTAILTHEFGASGIVIRCMFHIKPDCGRTKEQLIGYVNHVLINYARSNNIVIPYPHLTLDIPQTTYTALQEAFR